MSFLDNAGDQYDYRTDKQDYVIRRNKSELADFFYTRGEILSRKEQLQRAHAFPERGRYVEHIAYEHNEQGAENLEADKERILAADTQLIHRAVKERLHDYAYHDDNAVPYAERDVFPVRAVPDADYEEYDKRCNTGGKYLCDMRARSGFAKASTLHLLARVG